MKKFDKNKYLKKSKLHRWWQNYSKYFYIGIPYVLCLVLGIYFAYSKFFVSVNEDITKTTVGNFIYGDIVVTPYIDGKYSNTFPEKKTGINFEKVICDNDVTASWDEDKWGLYASNLSKRTKCNVYFVTPASCGINDNVSCISTREELVTLATEVNNGDNKSGKIIYLTNDLDLGGKFDSSGNVLDGNISWTPIGTEDNPFSGTFDGNGHIISNMCINRPTENRNALFGRTQKSYIKNVGIISSYVIGYSMQAALIGQGGDDNSASKISNSFSLATINGKYSRSAGLCAVYCNVVNSYNGGNITNGNEDLTGGILAAWGIVENSYNYGKITSSANSVGGIVGWMGSAINTYNLNTVSAVSNATGGILGCGDDKSTIINSYNSGKCNYGGVLGYQYGKSSYESITMVFKNNHYVIGNSSYGIYAFKSNLESMPLSESEMPSVLSVINGDNAFVEDTNNINNGYPILKWQTERENN